MKNQEVESCAATDALAFPSSSPARRVRAALVAGILRSGRAVPDEMFDEVYPDVIRKASAEHWTPMLVCQRAVELVGLRAGDRLLDVGAGVGKFCIAAAAMTGASVRGVERQSQLVAVAREAARRLMV